MAIVSLEKLIEEFRKMPSVGVKSAERMAYYILGLDDNETKSLVDAINNAHTNIHTCNICCNLTEGEKCGICSNPKRDNSVICVVENPRDVTAFERTHEYKGTYHVLHGVISPMNGVGPDNIRIKELISRHPFPSMTLASRSFRRTRCHPRFVTMSKRWRKQPRPL